MQKKFWTVREQQANKVIVIDDPKTSNLVKKGIQKAMPSSNAQRNRIAQKVTINMTAI